jgi:hypothetical protein
MNEADFVLCEIRMEILTRINPLGKTRVEDQLGLCERNEDTEKEVNLWA